MGKPTSIKYPGWFGGWPKIDWRPYSGWGDTIKPPWWFGKPWPLPFGPVWPD